MSEEIIKIVEDHIERTTKHRRHMRWLRKIDNVLGWVIKGGIVLFLILLVVAAFQGAV